MRLHGRHSGQGGCGGSCGRAASGVLPPPMGNCCGRSRLRAIVMLRPSAIPDGDSDGCFRLLSSSVEGRVAAVTLVVIVIVVSRCGLRSPADAAQQQRTAIAAVVTSCRLRWGCRPSGGGEAGRERRAWWHNVDGRRPRQLRLCLRPVVSRAVHEIAVTTCWHDDALATNFTDGARAPSDTRSLAAPVGHAAALGGGGGGGSPGGW
jgi:hypothetical protein